MSLSIKRSALTIASVLCLGIILALPAYAEGGKNGKGKRKGKRPTVEQVF